MHPQDILYHPKTHKEVVCSGFWVKGFKVKVDQDKSSLYLKIASSLGEGNGTPLQYSYLENPINGGAW